LRYKNYTREVAYIQVYAILLEAQVK